MSTFLLEIGTEELPADFSRLVIGQLESAVLRDLKERRLDHGSILATSTPRRISVIVENIALKASDLEDKQKGPPANKAFKDGEPTQAAIGFANRLGIETDKLEILDTSKGPFVFGKKIEHGQSSFELLKDLIPIWILGLQGRRFMRWGNNERRFSRPIRWIVSLLDETIIPLTIDDTDPVITSGKNSRGHRLFKDLITIESASNYFPALKDVGVIANRDIRFELIGQLIKEFSSRHNAIPDCSNELLNELTDLVESPSMIEGSIDQIFLELPAEVLSTVMKVHQRYVPLFCNESDIDKLSLDSKGILLPYFLCICNSLNESKDIVKTGNERVLRARLADARFFLEMDLSVASTDRVKALDKVVFADGLGSVLNRVNRITWITKQIVEKLNFNSEKVGYALQAAEFSKNDLVSQMVGEFPELQGTMGGKYLLHENKPYPVALAVLEQYLPRFSGDILPSSDIGSSLAISERFELIISIFYKGERPTGSSDPYALRRAGNGIMQIIWQRDWNLDINKLIQNSIDYWTEILPKDDVNKLTLTQDISEFILYRIINLLEEINIDPDIVQAIVGVRSTKSRILSDPYDLKLRAELLVLMRKNGKLNSLQNVFVRASKLADKGSLSPDILSPNDVIDESLFESQSETNLFSLLKLIEPITLDRSYDRYVKLSDRLCQASEVLENFFDGDQSVMVMTDDLDVRRNRLNLLGILRNQAYELADFSKLNG